MFGPRNATSRDPRSTEALDAASCRVLCTADCIGDFSNWFFTSSSPFLVVPALSWFLSDALLWSSWASNLWTRNPFCFSIFTVLWSLLWSCLPTRLLVCVRAWLMNLVPATTTLSISLMLLTCCSSYCFSILCIGLLALTPILTYILAWESACLSVD